MNKYVMYDNFTPGYDARCMMNARIIQNMYTHEKKVLIQMYAVYFGYKITDTDRDRFDLDISKKFQIKLGKDSGSVITDLVDKVVKSVNSMINHDGIRICDFKPYEFSMSYVDNLGTDVTKKIDIAELNHNCVVDILNVFANLSSRSLVNMYIDLIYFRPTDHQDDVPHKSD